MNKTIIININGIVFHIEEDAYDVLKIYMTDVKRHFSNSADSLEITTDIENRIAEMFNEALARENKQVIVEQDVKAVIEQMGTVEDFEFAENDAKAAAGTPFGYNITQRRLFRDPDDHLVSGVCAGIANYFDIDVAWVRLAFLASVAAAGMGPLLYIVLWIVVPKATTRADRMAMKGEKQDLKGFKKSFEEELGSVRSNLANMKQEAKPLVYKTRDFIGDLVDHLGVFLRGTGSVIGKIFAIIILVWCFAAGLGLIIAFIAVLASGDMGIYQIFPFNMVNHQSNVWFITGAFLLAGIPILSLALVTIGILFKNATFNRSIGTTMLCIWLAALGGLIFYGLKTAANFRDGGKFTKTVNLKPSSNNTYHLVLNETQYLSNEDSVALNINERFNGLVILDDDFNSADLKTPDNVRIDVEQSDVNEPVLVETFSARGRNLEDALTNARNTTYRFSQKDSVLKFDRFLEKASNFLWRGQELHLVLKVPVNSKVVVDNKLDRNVNFSLYDCNQQNNQDYASATTFIMKATGLECKVDTAALKIKAKADSLKAKADTTNNE